MTDTTDKLRILVAEDNRVMGNVIRFNLERSGFEVVLVHDGGSALKRLEVESFDMVITDYQMPNASGDDLCRYVRFDSPHRDIPVVLVSAKGMELQAADLVSPQRFSKVIYKPFSPLEIVKVANDVLHVGVA
ncbi:MAG: response regulator [Planctomycetaceae bacterium]|nr:response regulator [Planctomycetaceae bacterium]